MEPEMPMPMPMPIQGVLGTVIVDKAGTPLRSTLDVRFWSIVPSLILGRMGGVNC